LGFSERERERDFLWWQPLSAADDSGEAREEAAAGDGWRFLEKEPADRGRLGKPNLEEELGRVVGGFGWAFIWMIVERWGWVFMSFVSLLIMP